jgi:hypothetical protein
MALGVSKLGGRKRGETTGFLQNCDIMGGGCWFSVVPILEHYYPHLRICMTQGFCFVIVRLRQTLDFVYYKLVFKEVESNPCSAWAFAGVMHNILCGSGWVVLIFTSTFEWAFELFNAKRCVCELLSTCVFVVLVWYIRLWILIYLVWRTCHYHKFVHILFWSELVDEQNRWICVMNLWRHWIDFMFCVELIKESCTLFHL